MDLRLYEKERVALDNTMAPSSTNPSPIKNLIRPRSLSLHTSTSALSSEASASSNNVGDLCKNCNNTFFDKEDDERKKINCKRQLSRTTESEESQTSSGNDSQEAFRPQSDTLSLERRGTKHRGQALDSNISSNGRFRANKIQDQPPPPLQRENTRKSKDLETPILNRISEFTNYEKRHYHPSPPQQDLLFQQSTPTPANVNIENRQLNKQVLRKTPSTPSGSGSKLPTGNSNIVQQSSSSSNRTSAPTLANSPTKSRLTLPLSPGAVPTQSGQNKRYPLQDQNPFGADLVRYRNGATLTSANNANRLSLNGQRQISETSQFSNTSNTGLINAGMTIVSDKEDCSLLGKLNNGRGDTNLTVSSRTPDNQLDSPMDTEKTGAFYKSNDMWQDGNAAVSGGGFLRNRFSTRRIRNRLMQKDGECNISLHNVPKQRSKYFADIFTTLVEVKWRWCLLIFAMGFLLSWLLFAVVYYLIMLSHGDFNHKVGDPKWQFCVHNIRNFISVFMFSLESQHTIGYGSRYPSEECPAIVATVCLQSMVGVMIQTFMAGIVFAKLARAKKRAETLIFSKHAVVCMRDGKLCFLFRVGDMRKSQLAEAHVRVQMISKRITNEGELLPFHQFDMNVGYDAGLDRIFVVWPITICHVIDENSPLYEYSADDLATARFEIIAILEGVVPSTGTTTQARTSYLPQEIIWGSRFEKLVTYQRENGEYRIDFSKFHKTYTQETPTCSARDLDLLRVRPRAAVHPMVQMYKRPPIERQGIPLLMIDNSWCRQKSNSYFEDEAGLNLEEVYHIEGEEQAENQGLTPYSTVESRPEPSRPSILPSKEDRSQSVVDVESQHNHDHLQPPLLDEDEDETGRLLPNPPSTAALITMSPAERKASIAAAALAFRKNKSLSESARKASLVAYSRFRKPSINVAKVSASELTQPSVTTPAAAQQQATPLRTPIHSVRILRHASSTGSVACSTTGCQQQSVKARPSSILREHDIM